MTPQEHDLSVIATTIRTVCYMMKGISDPAYHQEYHEDIIALMNQAFELNNKMTETLENLVEEESFEETVDKDYQPTDDNEYAEPFEPQDMCDMNAGFVPVTPGGTICTHLACDTEDRAWIALMADAAHMPYKGKDDFIERGYAVMQFVATDDSESEASNDTDNDTTKSV